MPAEAIPESPAPIQSTATLLATAPAAAVSSVIGLGMFSYGASLAPSVAKIGDLQSLLPVPILGVVPATDGAKLARSAVRRKAVRLLTVAVGLVVLLAVAWLVVRT